MTAGTQQTNYAFDLANRLLTETNPLLKTTTLTYDGAGRQQTRLDANGHLTTYERDDNGRVLREVFDDGTFNQYAFDTRGNRTLEKSPSHERQLHHNALNQLDVVDDITFGKQLTNGYDAAGNRTRVSEGGVALYLAGLLIVATVFLVSAVVKAAAFDATSAGNLGGVFWISVILELTCGSLLAVGLFARKASLVLLLWLGVGLGSSTAT